MPKKKPRTNRRQGKAIALECVAWMRTPEGEKAMREAATRGTPVAVRLEAACRIDPADMLKPIGPEDDC